MKTNYNIEFGLDLTKEGVDEVEKVHGSMEQFIENCKKGLMQIMIEGTDDLKPEYGNIEISVNVKE